MDLSAVHVKNAHRIPLLLRNSISDGPISFNLKKIDRVFEIRVSRANVLSYRSLVVRAAGKKNHGSSNFSSSSGDGEHSIPEGDGAKRDYSLSDSSKSNDTTSHISDRKTLDWREFRAVLYNQEKAKTADTGCSHNHEGAHLKSKPLGLKWAHSIASPEKGCVLVASELLDGNDTFERTVVLLLGSGTRNPHEGPFGVIINRPLHRRIRHLEHPNHHLRTTFADCSLHFGGPLEIIMFLLRTGENTQLLPGFDAVVPGLYFHERNCCLDEEAAAAGLVKKGALEPQDFKFFVGYTAWEFDQLRDEIESKGYWHVAACSANLVVEGLTDSSSREKEEEEGGLREEILQLMGGQYAELSRKPKQDL